MSEETVVIYNQDCPICSREIELYRERNSAGEVPVRFEPIDAEDAKLAGLSAHEAARRLHVTSDGQLYSGVDAFVVLWRITPGFRWLAKFVSLPVIRPLAGALYEGILAPALFWMHVRRERRRKSC